MKAPWRVLGITSIAILIILIGLAVEMVSQDSKQTPTKPSVDDLRTVYPEPIYRWEKVHNGKGIKLYHKPDKAQLDSWAKWERWQVRPVNLSGRQDFIELMFYEGRLESKTVYLDQRTPMERASGVRPYFVRSTAETP